MRSWHPLNMALLKVKQRHFETAILILNITQLSHFLASLGAQEKTDCTSMLSSIDSCQNRVSADQYHLTVSRAQVSNNRGRVFFEVIR